jgi:TolB protein
MKKWISIQTLITFFPISQGFSQQNDLRYEKEVHFKNVRQFTFKGENAEAYWSFDDKSVVFQSTNPDWQAPCDQIFMLDFASGSATSKPSLLSTGKGRTTCAYFMPGNTSVVYASTHKTSDMCPSVPERSAGRYVWPIYDSYDIYVSDLSGKVIKSLTRRKGYDAEATVSPKGDLLVFTSDRSGDLELYTMDLKGKNVKQITFGLGYDGGAFFSPDGSKLVFRASRPKTDEEISDYKNLLAQGLVAPTNMEIYTCNVDGSDLKQVTHLGKANWAPFYHPSGRKIIFSSNHHSSRGFNFNLFMINEDGSGLEQISYDGVFDAFPMFSFDGKKIIFSSNRNNGGTKDTNIFVADWVE